MKRVRRILFNTLTAISLLLALATAGLWARSYSVWQSLYLKTGPLFWNIDSAVGEISIGYFVHFPDAPWQHYRECAPNPANSVTPVFAFYPGSGAKRKEWRARPLSGAYGQVLVSLTHLRSEAFVAHETAARRTNR